MRWSGGKSFNNDDTGIDIIVWAPQRSVVLLQRAKRRLEMVLILSAEAGDLCVQSLSVIPRTKNTIKEFMAVFTRQGDSSDMIYRLCQSALPK